MGHRYPGADQHRGGLAQGNRTRNLVRGPALSLLASLVPDRILTPIATDAQRGWIVLPDGGSSLGERLTGDALISAMVAALQQYGQLQVELAGHAQEILATGVSDMRPEVMAERFEQVMDIGRAEVDRTGRLADRAKLQAVADLRGTVAAWCAELADSQLQPSLDHNDLHPWNILTGDAGGALFYDWGDSVLAHPFAAMLVPLGFVSRLLDVPLDTRGSARPETPTSEYFASLHPVRI